CKPWPTTSSGRSPCDGPLTCPWSSYQRNEAGKRLARDNESGTFTRHRAVGRWYLPPRTAKSSAPRHRGEKIHTLCADQDVHRTRVHAAYILTRRVSEETASIQRRHTFPHLHFGVMTLVRQVYQLHTAHRAV